MLPKTCVSIEGDMIKVAMVNVISPISIDEIPDNVLDYISLKIDDKEVKDLSGLKILWEDKEFTMENISDAIGITLPVGGKMTLFFPNKEIGAVSGEERTIEGVIKEDNPINIKFKRTIQ